MNCRIVSSEDEFLQLGEKWDELVLRSADPNTFQTFEWLSCWWKSYRIEAQLHLILVEDDGKKLLGIAPLVKKQVKKFGLTYTAIFFLGDGTFETDHINFIADLENRVSVIKTLLASLANDPSWDVAHFNQIPEASANASDLLAWSQERGYAVTTLSLKCPVRSLPDSFETLISSMQPRARTTLRSTRKKIQAKYKVEFGLHQSIEEFPEALEALYANHASRWGAKGQAGVFSNPMRKEFYQSITKSFSEKGWLRFFYLKLDGRIVAQEFCFEYDGTVFLLQEGFDYGYASENVGNMLRGHVFEWLIKEGKRTYDFLEGVSRHKLIWSNGTILDLRIGICRTGWKGWLYHNLPIVQARAKGAIKDILPVWAKQKLGIEVKASVETE